MRQPAAHAALTGSKQRVETVRKVVGGSQGGHIRFDKDDNSGGGHNYRLANENSASLIFMMVIKPQLTATGRII